MKIPESPPNLQELIQEIFENNPSKKLQQIFASGISAAPNDTYYHWDKLRHLKSPPNDLNHREWWFGIKSARISIYQPIPHNAKDGTPFVFSEPNFIRRLLHEIDIHGGGELKASEQVTNPHTRNTYLINSLIEEAITSSQLEGAATTRKVAKDMLRQKRSPRNKSEKMIVNNYRAMEFISEIANEELTPSLILELHRILTVDTLENLDAAGSIRDSDDIHVGDERDATVLHVPPPYKEIQGRLESICDFANAADEKHFLHPVIKAIILHFLLAYDHPFEDGNGRTARALFYWSMLREGYWTMQFVSISRILKKAPSQYIRSYLYTETDGNDVTYFIVHQLNVIRKAIDELLEYLLRKSEEHKDIEELLKTTTALQGVLNSRQISALNRAMKDSTSLFTVESHRGAHNITYDTARTDLLKLNELGLLVKSKRGRAFVFTPDPDLRKNIEHLNRK